MGEGLFSAAKIAGRQICRARVAQLAAGNSLRDRNRRARPATNCAHARSSARMSFLRGRRTGSDRAVQMRQSTHRADSPIGADPRGLGNSCRRPPAHRLTAHCASLRMNRARAVVSARSAGCLLLRRRLGRQCSECANQPHAGRCSVHRAARDQERLRDRGGSDRAVPFFRTPHAFTILPVRLPCAN